MATILNTEKVLAKLTELGHNYSPAKQQYKASIAHALCEVFDHAGTAVRVAACDVEHFIGKGFTAKAPEPAATGGKK